METATHYDRDAFLALTRRMALIALLTFTVGLSFSLLKLITFTSPDVHFGPVFMVFVEAGIPLFLLGIYLCIRVLEMFDILSAVERFFDNLEQHPIKATTFK